MRSESEVNLSSPHCGQLDNTVRVVPRLIPKDGRYTDEEQHILTFLMLEASKHCGAEIRVPEDDNKPLKSDEINDTIHTLNYYLNAQEPSILRANRDVVKGWLRFADTELANAVLREERISRRNFLIKAGVAAAVGLGALVTFSRGRCIPPRLNP